MGGPAIDLHATKPVMGAFRRICAWCKGRLEPGDGDDERRPITHGICEPCAAAMIQQVTAGNLDSMPSVPGFEAPVILFDAHLETVAANRTAADVFGLRATRGSGLRPGDVIRCVNSFEPGGCGCTVHCAGCPLRGALEATATKGVPQVALTTHREVLTATGTAPLELTVTSERVDDVTLVRIDRASAPAPTA